MAVNLEDIVSSYRVNGRYQYGCLTTMAVLRPKVTAGLLESCDNRTSLHWWTEAGIIH